MVGSIANHKKTSRYATRNDMEAHETITLGVDSFYLIISKSFTINWILSTRYRDCGDIYGGILSTIITLRFVYDGRSI